jgi:hypothetical protein
LTNTSTGVTTNLAVVPNTNLPISVVTIRDFYITHHVHLPMRNILEILMVVQMLLHQQLTLMVKQKF